MDAFYTSELSPFGARLRMVAAMGGRAPPPIAPPPGGTGSAAMVQINPFGQTPALVIGGEVLIESLPLMEFLLEGVAGCALLPPDAVGRARVRGITLAHDNHVFAAMRPLLAQFTAPSPDRDVIVPAMAQVALRLTALTRLFDADGLAVGGTATLADISIAPFALLCDRMATRFDVASPYAGVARAREWWVAALAVPAIAADTARRQAALARLFGN